MLNRTFNNPTEAVAYLESMRSEGYAAFMYTYRPDRIVVEVHEAVYA